MKDPAVLFYIDKWFLATKEMKADCRGWYLNLILHQYDKKSLPNDIEELANLADVRISEFTKFKEVFEQVLKQKFILNIENRLENEFVNEILKNRELFLDKRSEAGKKSYFYKIIKNYTKDNKLIKYIFDNINFKEIDLKNKEVFEQVFKHLSELYISVSVNINKDLNINYNSIMDLYNLNRNKLPECKSLNDTRKGYINARVSEYNIEQLKSVILIACKSDFLNGGNDKQWKADFEWIIKPENFLKILEGKYNNKSTIPKHVM